MDTPMASRDEIRAILRDAIARLDDAREVDVETVGALASALADALTGGSAESGTGVGPGSGSELGTSIRRFVHDIRSASGTILTWAHLVRRGIRQEEAARGMAAVERTVRRQLALVEQLAAACAVTASAPAAPASGTPESTSSAGVPPADDAHDLDGVRILIVDDDADAREGMRTLLAARGADVATAISAIDAFDVLQRGRPDVLISDIVMPDADGYALLRRVRAPDTGERGFVPAIAVTGRAQAGDRERALGAGYQLHLTKPLDPAELIRAVRSLIGRA